MIISLDQLDLDAATKPDGWREAMLSAGTVVRRQLHISPVRLILIAAKWQQYGDAVETVARPVAKAIDRATAKMGVHTDVAGCGGCAARKARWNRR